MRTLRYTGYLMVRSLRESSRQLGFEFTNIFFPMFFFAVTVGSIGNVAARAFGVTDYTGFQMPVAILQGVAGASGSASLGLVTDIERGYFDKLLLTPAPRISLVFGRIAADGVRTVLLSVLILMAGLIGGADIQSGFAGAVVLLVMAGMFGVAYSGMGAAIALKTGNAQAAQVGFLLFFPLVFLSPAFAPKEVFARWLEVIATINPITYVVEGTRSLVLDGWDAQALVAAFGVILGLATLTMTMSLLALRSRTA